MDILIPWKPGCPYRQLNLDWVVAAHRDEGRKVVLGELEPDRPWVKALAVQEALKRSTADVIAVADGDVWVDCLDESVVGLDDHRWVVPFGDVHRLSPAATSAALQGQGLGGKLDQRAYLGVPGGGLVVIRREDYERVPLDPRFVGWGQEDETWGMAMSMVLGRPSRGVEPLYHLWHPSQPRQSRSIGSEQSRALRNQYVRAKQRGQMDSMVAEARDLLAQPV